MITQLERDASVRGPSMPVAPLAQPERLRVLHVVARLGLGGTEHGVFKVIAGLGEREFEHRICAVRGIDAGFASRMNPSLTIHAAGTPDPGFQFPLFRLAKIMREYRPHIVHTRNFGALEGIPSARMAGIPVAIHSEHGYELEILRGLPMRRRIFCRACYAMADAVFTVTGDLCSYHSQQSWLPTKKFRVIYNGVNTDKFQPRPEVGMAVRTQLGIPADQIVLGSVGRLVPIKDHGTLLRAAEILLQQGKNLHVLIVGSGPQEPILRSYVADSHGLASRVTFAGSSDRVHELLNAMDVFVLPSISEGMSNTLLEAMSSGLPVVATKAGGNPEIAEEDRSGLFFAPRDIRALAELIAGLTDDAALRGKMGEAARDRAIEQFSLDAMVQRYRNLYLELASTRAVTKGN